jgi:hypothetical protein
MDGAGPCTRFVLSRDWPLRRFPPADGDDDDLFPRPPPPPATTMPALRASSANRAWRAAALRRIPRTMGRGTAWCFRSRPVSRRYSSFWKSLLCFDPAIAHVIPSRLTSCAVSCQSNSRWLCRCAPGWPLLDCCCSAPASLLAPRCFCGSVGAAAVPGTSRCLLVALSEMGKAEPHATTTTTTADGLLCVFLEESFPFVTATLFEVVGLSILETTPYIDTIDRFGRHLQWWGR